MENTRSGILKGTTTVGVVFKNGVVLAADKRASAQTFIASKVAKKLHPISDRIVVSISGLVADAQVLVRWMQGELRKFSISRERQVLVSEAANLLALVLHTNFKKLLPFTVHFLIGGVDVRGPHIFFLDHAGGANEEKYMSTGSGSPIALGVLEANFKRNMTENQAIKLALKALRSAIRRDAATGDGIDLVVITPEQLRFLKPDEIDKHLSGLSKVFSEG
ncbi:MAG: proteasome subunit beta [Candidatus Njordarchaeia archaeon]|nr:proteasome subunit beta [Candidatus Korarchaeota archaeon]